MNHTKVLKRAWEITWRYRVLWIFGIIVALTAVGGGFSGSSGGSGGGSGNGEVEYHITDEDLPLPEWFPELEWEDGYEWEELSPQIRTTIIVVSVALLLSIVLLFVVNRIARYVAETALLQMVDRYEETGEKLGVRQGFRLGWSRTSWRLFLIALLFFLLTMAAAVAILLPIAGLTTLSILAIEREVSIVLGVIGLVAGTGLLFTAILLGIVVGTALKALMRFFWRACALEGLGVRASIREGFGLVKRHFVDVLVMWLIMVGVQLGWAIATIAVMILLFPIILLWTILGGVIGSLPALLVFGLTSLFLEGAWPWVIAALAGIPIFILVLATPGVFLNGLMEVFSSSVWTLTYRELRTLESIAETEE